MRVVSQISVGAMSLSVAAFPAVPNDDQALIGLDSLAIFCDGMRRTDPRSIRCGDAVALGGGV
jgi:hypothetical protein